MQPQFLERVEIVKDFLNSIGNLDFDRVARHLSEEAVMVLPFIEQLPPLRGRSAIVGQLRESVPRMFERMNFTYDEWYEVCDAEVVIAEYQSESLQRGTGALYANSYITVFRFDGVQISLYKEYLNPVKMVGLALPADDA